LGFLLRIFAKRLCLGQQINTGFEVLVESAVCLDLALLIDQIDQYVNYRCNRISHKRTIVLLTALSLIVNNSI
jgi:hypothetical protein